MLRLLFQSLEQTFGSTLSSVASLVYWGGMGALGIALIVLLCRRWMELAARNFGIHRHWVMTCRTCGRQTVVTRRYCGYCEADLKIPFSLVLWTGATRRRAHRRLRQLAWTAHLIGTLLFIVASIWLLQGLDALRPEGELQRLFLGIVFLSWTGLGWFTGDLVHLGPLGTLSRLRDGILVLASLGILTIALVLTTQAGSISETILARFSTDSQWAYVGDQRVATPGGQIEFEYLQLDHEVLGYHQVVSLAFLGTQRVPAPPFLLRQRLAQHLHKHADAYAARGLTIRLRTDRVHVTPDQSYEVVTRSGQVLIRRVGRI